MLRIIPSVVLFATLITVFSSQLQAKSYPRLDLQNCWVDTIESGASEFDEVNKRCEQERTVVEMEVPEAVRPITRESLDDALKKQLKELSQRSTK